MKHEPIGTGDLFYAPCRYGISRLVFRGPKRDLNKPYLAFVGGTETYGRFIDHPFPALVEKSVRRPCVNLGYMNGGVDAFVNDPTIMGICKDADLTVVQIMGANYLSNRFYAVHPRRNDRFLRASSVLKAIYHDVDFSEFTFTRHMLNSLHEKSPERFEIVICELREAWVARMKSMLFQIGPRAVLLWFSDHDLTDDPWHQCDAGLQADPLFITASMMKEIQPLALGFVVSKPSEVARQKGTNGMHFPALEAKSAAQMMGVGCHEETSATLAPVLRKYMAKAAD